MQQRGLQGRSMSGGGGGPGGQMPAQQMGRSLSEGGGAGGEQMFEENGAVIHSVNFAVVQSRTADHRSSAAR